LVITGEHIIKDPKMERKIAGDMIAVINFHPVKAANT
jgi:hypothetical protein